MSETKEQTLPLSGLRILELGHFIAAPFCTRILADLGAEVIKVEQPGHGDPVRRWGKISDGQEESVWWSVHGRNKKSVSINLKDPEGIKVVRELLPHVDALVENFKPDQLAEWGLDREEIDKANPDIVVVRISGYGQTGPERDRAAFGLIGEAIGGLRHLTGYPPEVTDLPPVRVGVSIGDSIAGLYGAIGLLASVYAKGAGKNQTANRYSDVALSESVFSLLEGCLPEYGHFGDIRQPQGSSLSTTAPSNAYPSADGKWFLIGANSDSLFMRLCRVMEREKLAFDLRFKDNPSRVRNRVELDEEIVGWTRTKPLAELQEIAKAADIPSSGIYTIADIAADANFQHRGMVQKVQDPRLGEVLHPGMVPNYNIDPSNAVRWCGPKVGEHNNEILSGMLGMSAKKIHQLAKQGTI
ncbi:CaiB/BaiF CoA-transferase family protein [uncultured Sneathiella sp.]|uniref:CaiB/BaiF CoA transferase family protein n=1 Tax=uncultured Sneathiella sp. TaxID=879315 RepID=UPI0030ED008A|tara:strand:- start:17826 stop:19064 length:1239 start_codon:yes stop_codon:yes gene_type:complete